MTIRVGCVSLVVREGPLASPPAAGDSALPCVFGLRGLGLGTPYWMGERKHVE